MLMCFFFRCQNLRVCVCVTCQINLCYSVFRFCSFSQPKMRKFSSCSVLYTFVPLRLIQFNSVQFSLIQQSTTIDQRRRKNPKSSVPLFLFHFFFVFIVLNRTKMENGRKIKKKNEIEICTIHFQVVISRVLHVVLVSTSNWCWQCAVCSEWCSKISTIFSHWIGSQCINSMV